MALSAEAQSVLADLHSSRSDEENGEDRGKGHHHRSSRRKRSETPGKNHHLINLGLIGSIRPWITTT